MQDITHLYKTSPHNLESYKKYICKNFYEIASYSLVFANRLLVASCLPTNCNEYRRCISVLQTLFAYFF